MKYRHSVYTASALAALLVALAAPAFAQTYPVEQGTLQFVGSSGEMVQPTSDGAIALESRTTLTIEGGGYEPGSEVQIFLESDPILLGVTQADEFGFISVTITIPDVLSEGIEAGTYTIKAVGEDASGGTLVLAQAVSIGQLETDSGFPIALAAMIGTGSLAVLAVAFMFVRSR